jgi:hypothetical protein
MFGDSGFHLDYPRPWDYERPFFSEEEYREYERDKWRRDKRPPEDYEAIPLDVSPVTGNIVPASGMNQISTAMTNYCRDIATCNFGLLLGDNVYPVGATLGADGVDDAKRFKDMLADPFGNIVHEPDDYLTYSLLGNHDYMTSREAAFAQIEFLENADGFYMDGPFYTARPPGADGRIELFMIDTNMMLATVPVLEAHLNDDGSEKPSDVVTELDYYVEPLSDAEKNMVHWLEDQLKKSTAEWKIVVGHHPLWSSKGEKHQETRVLRGLILPMLCRYADAYIAGHSHTLEVHTDSCETALGYATEEPLVHVISGAASRQRPLHTSFMRHQEAKYPQHETLWAKGMVWGFAHMHIKGEAARVSMISVPDDGSADMTVDFEYEFNRRSHRTNSPQ